MALGRTGLRQGIVLFALAAIVLPLSILGYLFISHYERVTLEDLRRENLHLTAAVGNDVATFLDAPLRQASLVATLAGDPAFSPQIDTLLYHMVKKYRFFESIMVLDRQGVVRHLGLASNLSLIHI